MAKYGLSQQRFLGIQPCRLPSRPSGPCLLARGLLSLQHGCSLFCHATTHVCHVPQQHIVPPRGLGRLLSCPHLWSHLCIVVAFALCLLPSLEQGRPGPAMESSPGSVLTVPGTPGGLPAPGTPGAATSPGTPVGWLFPDQPGPAPGTSRPMPAPCTPGTVPEGMVALPPRTVPPLSKGDSSVFGRKLCTLPAELRQYWSKIQKLPPGCAITQHKRLFQQNVMGALNTQATWSSAYFNAIYQVRPTPPLPSMPYPVLSVFVSSSAPVVLGRSRRSRQRAMSAFGCAKTRPLATSRTWTVPWPMGLWRPGATEMRTSVLLCSENVAPMSC